MVTWLCGKVHFQFGLGGSLSDTSFPLLVMDFHVPELGCRFVLDFLLTFWTCSILPAAGGGF